MKQRYPDRRAVFSRILQFVKSDHVYVEQRNQSSSGYYAYLRKSRLKTQYPYNASAKGQCYSDT